jgi:hypothetical protein
LIAKRSGEHISDPVGKTNSLNSYYSSVFTCERNIPEIHSTSSDKPFTFIISFIRRRLAMIGRNKSVRPDCIPGKMLKMGGGKS